MKILKISIVTALFIAVLVVPSFASADVASDLRAQIDVLFQQIKKMQTQLEQIESTTGSYPTTVIPEDSLTIPSFLPTDFPVKEECEIFSQDLYVGMKDFKLDGKVTKLQKFLAKDSEIYPEKLITGYFGPLTKKAVQRWQVKKGIISEDRASDTISEDTGYGVVGPKTRAKIKDPLTCLTPTYPIPGTPTTPTYPIPGTPTTPGINQPPVIHGLSGPTSLSVSQFANWKVKASDPERGPLSYSVVWGDESDTVSGGAFSKALTYTQTASFSHSYSKAGIYYPTFTVTDNNGLSAKSSISVSVGTSQVQTGSIKITVIDDDRLAVCDTPNYCGIINTAKVSIYDKEGKFIGSEDTSRGAAVFKKLSVGEYIAYVSVKGFEKKKESFQIKAGVGGYLKIFVEREDIAIPSNQAPKIIGYKIPPASTLRVDQQLDLVLRAEDFDKDNLFWTISWGDEKVIPNWVCQASGSQNKEGWEKIFSHAWRKAGIYKVMITVTDCKGGSDSDRFKIKIDDVPLIIEPTNVSTKKDTNQMANVLNSTKSLLNQMLQSLTR